MSIEDYEKQQTPLLDLYQKLSEAEAVSASDAHFIPHDDLMLKLRNRVNENANTNSCYDF